MSGCGCGGKKTFSSGMKTNANNYSSPKAPKGAVCQEKYDELAMLDKKVIDLFKRFKWSTMGHRYAEIQKVIRGWISNLKNECPDEAELASYREYINKEYNRYFSASKK